MNRNGRKLVYYLEKVEPETLLKLSMSFPSAEAIFSSNMKLGGGAKPERQEAYSSAEISLLISGIARLKIDLEAALSVVRRRMVASQRARMAGGMVAASAGAVSAIAEFLGKSFGWVAETIALGGAIVSSLGGLLTVSADSLERSPSGMRFSGSEYLTSLGEARVDLGRVALRIEKQDVRPMSADEIESAMKVMDDLALRMLRFNVQAL